jgi:hypothetical protein
MFVLTPGVLIPGFAGVVWSALLHAVGARRRHRHKHLRLVLDEQVRDAKGPARKDVAVHHDEKGRLDDAVGGVEATKAGAGGRVL